MKKMLVYALWKSRNPWSFGLGGLGLFVGLALALVAFQLYQDLGNALEPVSKNQSSYLIVNKNIGFLNTIGLASSRFSDVLVDSLARMPAVVRVGRFGSSGFQAMLGASGNIGFSTLLFFESVPDAFLDTIPPEFAGWHSMNQTVPIILSQEFLNLYNFGFALGQGLPQLSQQAARLLPLQLQISGPGGQRTMGARIVAFSQRISSVLVPEKFLKLANQTIAQQARPPDAARLIFETTDPQHPALAQFLAHNGLKINEELLRVGKASRLAQTSLVVVGGMGLLFVLLASVLFATQFRAIVAQSAEQIRIVCQIGYTSWQVSAHLSAFFVLFLLIIFACGGIAAHIAAIEAEKLLIQAGFAASANGLSAWSWLGAIAFLALQILLNTLMVLQLTRKASK